MSDGFINQIRTNVRDFYNKLNRDRSKETSDYRKSLREYTDEDIIMHHEAYPGNVPLKLEMQRRGLLKDYGVR